MRIDRWNGNTLRRYHFANGSIGIVARNSAGERKCAVIPAACRHISVDVAPATLAAQLVATRATLAA